MPQNSPENQMERTDIESLGPIESSVSRIPAWMINTARILKITLIAEAQGFALSNATVQVLNTFLAGIPGVNIPKPLSMIGSPVIGTVTSFLSLLRQMDIPRAQAPDQVVQAATVGIAGTDFLMLLLSQFITSAIRSSQNDALGHHGPYQNSTQFAEILFNHSCASLFNSTFGYNETHVNPADLQIFNSTGTGLILPICEPNWAAALENLLAASVGLLWSAQYHYLQKNTREPFTAKSKMNQVLTHSAMIVASAGLGTASVLHGTTYLFQELLSNPQESMQSDIRYALTGLGFLAGAVFNTKKKFQLVSQGLSMTTLVLAWVAKYFISPEAKEIYGEDAIDEQAILWSLLPMVLLMTQLLMNYGPGVWRRAAACFEDLDDPRLQGELDPLLSTSNNSKRIDSLLVQVTDLSETNDSKAIDEYSNNWEDETTSDEETEEYSSSGEEVTTSDEETEEYSSSGEDDNMAVSGSSSDSGVKNHYRWFSEQPASDSKEDKPSKQRRPSF